MHLQHLHLPNLTPYLRASTLQSHLVRQHLTARSSNTLPSPPPYLLTFTPPPTYTCGRREISRLSTSQIAHLQHRHNGERAEFHEALRGGQTTFHGPGQLVAYLILTLPAHALTPRAHINLLEQSVIETCESYGLDGVGRTENPGVWTAKGEKIASVGVHLRRYVSSHGIALNVHTDLAWFERIVACGLPGKKATSLSREGVGDIGVEDVARVYSGIVGRLLDVEGVKGIDEASVEMLEGEGKL